uniref:Putative ovule protein n=1 Tax=Solanum chacoense TaxID=4108 RepID=A0A0V0H8T3_SOLCH
MRRRPKCLKHPCITMSFFNCYTYYVMLCNKYKQIGMVSYLTNTVIEILTFNIQVRINEIQKRRGISDLYYQIKRI